MRIAVVGVGAVGGYFGGRLVQAGLDVVFIARGKTLGALKSGGLRIESIAGDFEIAEPNVVGDAAEAGLADVVLVAVKATQVADVAPTLKLLVGPETVVIPMQNGLDAPPLLAEALGKQPVIGGLCKIFASKTDLRTVKHIGLEPAIEFGERDGSKSERVERIRAAFDPAQGMTTTVADNIEGAMWQKLLYVEPLGGVGAVSRAPIGVVRSVPETREMLSAAMREVVALALKRGVAMDPQAAEAAIRRIDKLAPGTTASMHRDIVEGRPSELESQVGVVVRYGRESGVPTPVHSAIYAALLPSELRARGDLPS